jgi:hypothetical protein
LYNPEETMPARQSAPCILCRETLEICDAGATFTLMGRLVGVPDMPQLYAAFGIPDPPKSESGQVYMCVECCVDFAMGKIPPPSQALYVLAYEIMSRMVGKNPAIIVSAWQELRERVELPPVNLPRTLSDGMVMPPLRRLKEAG